MSEIEVVNINGWKNFRNVINTLLGALPNGRFWCSYPVPDIHDLFWQDNVTNSDMCHITSLLIFLKARGGLAPFLFFDLAVLTVSVVMETSSVCVHHYL